MFFLNRPSESQISTHLKRCEASRPTYPNPGFTHPEATLEHPKTFHVDQNRILLGQGQATFERASAALFSWEMYQTGWTFLSPQSAVECGSVHGVTAKHFGFYSLNPVQVIYKLHSETTACFAVGSLPGHVEHGEERFLVELTPDGVYFEILAVSQPASILVRLAGPLGRRVQSRFFEAAQERMLTAVKP